MFPFTRLEAYDRNFNFKDPSQMDVETGSYSMQLPDLKLYRDINQSTKVCITCIDYNATAFCYRPSSKDAPKLRSAHASLAQMQFYCRAIMCMKDLLTVPAQ